MHGGLVAEVLLTVIVSTYICATAVVCSWVGSCIQFKLDNFFLLTCSSTENVCFLPFDFVFFLRVNVLLKKMRKLGRTGSCVIHFDVVVIAVVKRNNFCTYRCRAEQVLFLHAVCLHILSKVDTRIYIIHILIYSEEFLFFLKSNK